MMEDKRTAFVKVEYDPDFTGGDYSGTGDFLLVSHASVDQPGGIERAFSEKSGLPSECIVHYTVDELYAENGDRIEDPEPDAGFHPGV